MVSEFFYFGYIIASCSSVNSWLFRRPSSLLPVFPSSLLSRNCSVLGVGFSVLFISWIVGNVFLSKVYMKGKLWSLIGLKIPFFVPHALMLGNSSVKIYPRTWTILLALTIIWWEVWCLSDSWDLFSYYPHKHLGFSLCPEISLNCLYPVFFFLRFIIFLEWGEGREREILFSFFFKLTYNLFQGYRSVIHQS